MLAAASDAVILGFNVRPVGDARAVAEREGVEIRTYSVIYRRSTTCAPPCRACSSRRRSRRPSAPSRSARRSAPRAIGTIAGSYVTDGTIRRGAKVRVVRDGTVVYDTTIDRLQRFNDDVREVAAGFECGIVLANFQDVKEGDVLEVYETRKVERELPSARTGRRRAHPHTSRVRPRSPVVSARARHTLPAPPLSCPTCAASASTATRAIRPRRTRRRAATALRADRDLELERRSSRYTSAAASRRRRRDAPARSCSPPMPASAARLEHAQREFWYSLPHSRSPSAIDCERAVAILEHFWRTSGRSPDPPSTRSSRSTRARAPSPQHRWYRARWTRASLAEQPPRRSTARRRRHVLWPEHDPLFPLAWSDRLDEFSPTSTASHDRTSCIRPGALADAISALA